MLRIRDVYPGFGIPDPDPQHCIFSINSGTEHRAGGGSREPRTAIELSFSAGGGLEKLDRGRDRGETFFPDSGSDRDSDETFQISLNLGLELVEFVCLLDSQLWLHAINKMSSNSTDFLRERTPNIETKIDSIIICWTALK